MTSKVAFRPLLGKRVRQPADHEGRDHERREREGAEAHPFAGRVAEQERKDRRDQRREQDQRHEEIVEHA